MKIGFIGAGKAGKALGRYFKRHGLSVSGFFSRSNKSAQEAAALTGSKEFASINDLADDSSIIFITVPDHALEEIDATCTALITDCSIGPEKIWLHVSGAHPSSCLAGIKAAGCATGSMHPLLSFGDPVSSATGLEQTWFTLEGTERAVSAAAAILEKTGGKYSLIEAENKPLYHAGACVISNFLVTLLESGIKFFEAAGMERENVFKAIEPLIDATLSNVREKGTINALTGPIVRADFNTVGVHMRAIKTALPPELDLYKALALKTAQMLEDKRLTHEQTGKFRLILEETDYDV